MKRVSSINAPACALVALLFCAVPAPAQDASTDRDSPTPLSTNEIRGEGPGKDATYYYSFNAGRGELRVTLDVTATRETAASGGAELEIFDEDSRQLLKMFLHLGHGENKRDTKSAVVRGAAQQALVLKLKVEGGNDKYLVRLAGPAVQGPPGATPQPAPGDRMCLPATGTLVLTLADGTAHEVDLSQVTKASVKP